MRRTSHRRRFHTDRIVRARRARYLRETPTERPLSALQKRWLAARLSYGRLATMDPWDCGRPQCGACRHLGGYQRHEQKRLWRKDWDA